MNMSGFEKIVKSAVRKIPAKFRAVLKKEGVKVLPRAQMPKALKGPEGDLTLGVFMGPAYTERSQFSFNTEPVRIELYKDSFEKCFGDPGEMKEQIALTVIHEAGHYFGFSEKELRKFMGE